MMKSIAMLEFMRDNINDDIFLLIKELILSIEPSLTSKRNQSKFNKIKRLCAIRKEIAMHQKAIDDLANKVDKEFKKLHRK